MEESKEEQNITDNENVPLVKKKRVINAPRSEKQIEAFKLEKNIPVIKMHRIF